MNVTSLEIRLMLILKNLVELSMAVDIVLMVVSRVFVILVFIVSLCDYVKLMVVLIRGMYLLIMLLMITFGMFI